MTQTPKKIRSPERIYPAPDFRAKIKTAFPQIAHLEEAAEVSRKTIYGWTTLDTGIRVRTARRVARAYAEKVGKPYELAWSDLFVTRRVEPRPEPVEEPQSP